MNRIIIIILGFILVFCSCKAYLARKYGFNRDFNFTERKDYIRFLEEEKGFDISRVIYPDSTSHGDFIGSISKEKLSTYYGCLKNDSTELVKSDFLKDNLNCVGRMLTEIKKDAVLAKAGIDTLITRSEFRKYKFRRLHGNDFFNINDSGKKLKLVLIYSYTMGTYFDPFYKEVLEYYNTYPEDLDLFIISLDVIQNLR